MLVIDSPCSICGNCLKFAPNFWRSFTEKQKFCGLEKKTNHTIGEKYHIQVIYLSNFTGSVTALICPWICLDDFYHSIIVVLQPKLAETVAGTIFLFSVWFFPLSNPRYSHRRGHWKKKTSRFWLDYLPENNNHHYCHFFLANPSSQTQSFA